MSASMLAVEGLRVRRGRRLVLDVPHLNVSPNEVLAVIGPNGAGKSTLLQALALLLPAEMLYFFDGQPVDLDRSALHLRRQMAVVFQEPLLLSGRVLDNVALGLRLRHLPRSVARDRAQHWLERLGVGHLAQRSTHALSGGEAQRVNLARALALEPRVLFMDEPLAALDAITRAALLRDLGPILRGAGVTALFVTHDFREIPPLANRLAVIIDGRVVQTGTPAEVFASPTSAEVEQLIRAGADLTLTGPVG